MSELISKALLCGLGLASLTKEAIQKSVEEFVNQSKLSEEEGRKLVKDLQRRSARAQKALEKHADTMVHTLFENLNPVAIINDRLAGPRGARKVAQKSPRRRRRATKTAKR